MQRIKFKLRDDFQLKSADIPTADAVIKHENSSYIILRGTITGNEIEGYNNQHDKFYLGVEAEINDKMVTLTGTSKLFKVNNDSSILNVRDTEGMKFNQYCHDIKQRIELYFWSIIDNKSVDGKLILLENLVPGFDYEKKNYPEWMLEPMKELNWNFMRRIKLPKGYVEDYIEIDKLVGTEHPDYKGESWLDAYLYLKRPNNIMNAALNPEYYDKPDNPYREDSSMEFYKVDDEFYVSSGSHRSIIAKIKGIEKLYAPIVPYKTDYKYKKLYTDLINKGLTVKFKDDFEDDWSFTNSIERNIAMYELEEEWEVFLIEFPSKILELYGFSMIQEFINTYEELPTNEQFIKQVQRDKSIKEIRNKFSFLLPKKQDFMEADDEPTSVNRFFEENLEMLIEHKIANPQYKK